LIDDAVKIFGNDFDTLRILGNSLASKTSHKIMHLLQHEEMYANEISKKLGISLNLVSFHLTKLEKIGVVKVTYRRMVKNGSEHKYYKMMPNIFISMFETKKEIHETGFLRKIFRDDVKFVSVGLGVLGSWFLSRGIFTDGESSGAAGSMSNFSIDWFSLNYDVWVPIVVVSASVLLAIILKTKLKRH